MGKKNIFDFWCVLGHPRASATPWGRSCLWSSRITAWVYSLYISIQYPLYRLIAVHPHLFCTLCTVSATFWNILECSRTCTPAFDFQPDFQPSAFSLPILVFSLQLCKTGHYLALAWPQFCQCNLYTFFKFALTDWWTDGRSDNIVL